MIALVVRWYLRCGLSYRDLEELLAERGVEAEPRLRVAAAFEELSEAI